MKPKVYIETTILSFYHETRTDAAAVARQQWTRQWWDKHRRNYELLTSVAVLGELQSDFLLTWNCQHLANANKFGHIRRVNTLLGLFVPDLVTPLELLGEDENEG